jgi:hypothetical protein
MGVWEMSPADGARVSQWTHTGNPTNAASGDYIALPWRMGVLTQTNSTC